MEYLIEFILFDYVLLTLGHETPIRQFLVADLAHDENVCFVESVTAPDSREERVKPTGKLVSDRAPGPTSLVDFILVASKDNGNGRNKRMLLVFALPVSVAQAHCRLGLINSGQGKLAFRFHFFFNKKRPTFQHCSKISQFISL